MIHGQKPKYQIYWFYINQESQFMQRSILTYSVDHTVLVEDERSTIRAMSEIKTDSFYKENYTIKVEIPNT